MDNLTVFDRSWEIDTEPKSDEHLELAVNISAVKRRILTTYSSEAKEVMYIYGRKVRKAFVETLLFAEADFSFIAKHTGMAEETLAAYKAIFFDTDKLRGSIGFTEYVEDLLMYNEDSEEYNFGKILREARYGGTSIILEQFDINIDVDDMEEKKTLIAQQAIWDTRNARRDGTMEDNRVRLAAAKDIMTIVEKSARTAGTNTSSIDGIVSAIKSLNTIEPAAEIEMPVFNRELEEYVDVEAIEYKEATK